MTTASRDSSPELREEPVAGGPGGGRPAATGGAIWLDGGVLACACPDCGAPMSIRIWLATADCWRCGAGIELTEEQEQEAQRLLERRELAGGTGVSPVTRPQHGQDGRGTQSSQHGQDGRGTRAPSHGQVGRGTDPQSATRRLVHRRASSSLLRHFLRHTPAWLASLVFHAVALLLMGIWFGGRETPRPHITLATAVSEEDIPGEEGKLDASLPEAFDFKDAGAIDLKQSMEVVGLPKTAESEVEMTPVDVPPPTPEPVGILPSAAASMPLPLTQLPPGKMFAGRDAKARARYVQTTGGTSETEAAVARGLKFLARHQQADGSWSFNAFHRTPDCDASCTGAGGSDSRVAATALGLLPFLGAGQTHREGEYRREVDKGLTWLLARQAEDGDLRGDGDGRMYAHGQAAIVLCEAFALTGDDEIRPHAQAAINFIVRAQHPQGGWRYSPGEAADTSVVGWQLMALKSGQMANLYVPQKAFDLAAVYLDRAKTDQLGGQYGYQPGHHATPAMTAEALLCRQYLGWPKDHPGMTAGIQYLIERHAPEAAAPNIYYWYYGTQAMHHVGGNAWAEWNARMRPLLVESQVVHGHSAGSWNPVGRGNEGGHADRGGRFYMTALAVCILEVYYRHLPLYGEEVMEPVE